MGEVARYTLTYTPSLDRILPPPTHLQVKIKNTSAVPLRAAYLHGPYTLYVACYPSTFDPNTKQVNEDEEGVPDFEPQLKAGGHWYSKLKVPEEVREDAKRSTHTRQAAGERKSFTWIIEVASQVLFSTTAAVHFEVLVGRDERSVDLGFHGVVGSGQGAPGKLEDHQQGRSRNSAQPKGVFSKAVRLAVDDTESLWNTPAFPEWDEKGQPDLQQGPQHGDKRDASAKADKKSKKQKRIHLVMLTHGLHSNLGADMLYMKESIDTAAKLAREDAKKKRQETRSQRVAESNDFGRGSVDVRSQSVPDLAIAPTNSTVDDEEDEDEEEVLVRGFRGNAVKTEKGIQYLGKRFAKYVLSLTYPDQPFLPVKSSISKSITRTFTNQKPIDQDGKKPIHKNSSIMKDEKHTNHNLPYKITSISFVGHSLGGLIQTYAIAYIQKHSPGFFDLIKPVNFVAMATPFLGLSNENPMYVKFALDFGLVGRTGQDLGLTWRAPTLARKGWGAMMPDFSGDGQKGQKEADPQAKPLLRILPTGPAHGALRKFRNRTVYSNVVNDGIVPLRTSCLLFLDWRGLERVEKARRENGLVGTMVEWGWAEMMGQNASAPRQGLTLRDLFSDSGDESNRAGKTSPDPSSKVPQAEASQGIDDDHHEPKQHQFLDNRPTGDEAYEHEEQQKYPIEQANTMWQGFMSFFKPQASGRQKPSPPKTQKMYRRGQTMKHHGHHGEDGSAQSTSQEGEDSKPGPLVRGPSLYSAKSENGDLMAPPKTTVFESAGDLLNPPLPPREYILDPSARPRTIFHDRVYHPDDIPAPPSKRPRTFLRRQPSKESALSAQTKEDHNRRPSSVQSNDTASEVGTMKIEEKIARAYHKDLSWRKVLVRLEPDAHNNLIVRRMFANAYGWPVVKHMCDTHFAYTEAALTRDEDEVAKERAKPAHEAVGSEGEQVKGQVEPPTQEEIEKTKTASEPMLTRRASAEDPASELKSPDKLHADYKPKERPKARFEDIKNRENRTPSEVRESRDELSDLVSKVSVSGTTATPTSGAQGSLSKLNSSKRTLSKLSRADSGRWSDKFFEGSDDDSDLEEDPEYIKEIEAARRRGEVLTGEQEKALERWSESSKGSKGRKGSERSEKSASSKSGDGKGKTVFREDRMMEEPGEMNQKEEEALEKLESGDSRSKGDEVFDAQMLGLTGVGLGKSVDEQVQAAPESPIRAKGGRRESLGKAEQVALAQAKKEAQEGDVIL